MYRALPCLCVKHEAGSVRMVSAFAPYRPGDNRLVHIQASADIGSDSFRLIWNDGSTQELFETELMNR